MRFVLEAEAIVVATVVEVGEPPLHWSGFAAAYQTVQYTVDTQIKGDLSVESTISVRHPVVAGAPSADPDRPGLSPTLFRLGNRLILLLSRDGEQLIVSHENVGARLYTPALEASIREALR